MYNKLITHINRYVPLTEEEKTLTIGYFRHEKIARKQFLLREGEVCKASYFIVKGCLRMFFIRENGTEQIVQFAIENWWLSDYSSFISQKPGLFFIQAVEDTEVAMLDFYRQNELSEKVSKIDRYFRSILQKNAAAEQMRLYYFFDQSGEERYRHFTESFPGFVQRIPQYMLASMLHITPEFLSKIRAKK